MIRAIDFNRPRKYYNKDDRMKNFMLNWFINGEEEMVMCVSKDSIMYPSAFTNKLTMLIYKRIELRQLSMDSEEDKWFVKELKTLPKIIYDQTMLAKLLPKPALLSLEQNQV